MLIQWLPSCVERQLKSVMCDESHEHSASQRRESIEIELLMCGRTAATAAAVAGVCAQLGQRTSSMQQVCDITLADYGTRVCGAIRFVWWQLLLASAAAAASQSLRRRLKHCCRRRLSLSLGPLVQGSRSRAGEEARGAGVKMRRREESEDLCAS